MARRIRARLKIEGSMVVETPLHVGGYGQSPDTDLLLAQNGKGEWYVPGTSIAGALRSWCGRNFKEQNGDAKKIITNLFGPKRRPGIEEGHASFVMVEDATINDGNELFAEIRDGVGIDRFFGVAADKAKYDRAVLPRGTSLALAMTIEVGGNQDPRQTNAVILHLLEALTKSRVRFGAAKTRGLGRVKLKNCRIKEEKFSDFESIIRLLKDENVSKPFATWLNDFEASISEEEKTELKKLKTEQSQLIIELTWKPRLPVMVKAGYDGIGVDMLPVTSGVDTGKLALVLPGSSIKGVLRSQAERIMRTLLPDSSTKGKDFHDQIDAIPLIEELFGACSKAKDNNQKANPNHGKNFSAQSNAKLGLGALAIDDCYAKETLERDQWRRVEVARDDRSKGEPQQQNGSTEVSYFKRELWQYLRQIDEQKANLSIEEYAKDTTRFKIQHHVAIDRWTGGAADGALYSVLAPAKVEWEPMRLTLDFGRFEEGSRLPALMLLLLTLRDIAEGHLPFGFATNRGMGEIEVSEIAFAGDSLKEIGFAQHKGSFVDLKNELQKNFPSEAWKEWLNTLKT